MSNLCYRRYANAQQRRYQPDGINCIEPQRPRVGKAGEAGPAATDERVAVARSNGSIEVWNISSGWHMERVVPGGEDISVETMVWVGDRLFTAGLHSMVTEWSVARLRVEATVDSFGGSVWCMAIDPDGGTIAAGCEDGALKLLDISGGGLEYVKSLDKQEGRILSADWHTDGQTIVRRIPSSTRLSTCLHSASCFHLLLHPFLNGVWVSP